MERKGTTWLVGIEDGQAVQASAGETRPVVRLSVVGGEAVIQDRRFRLGDDTLVLWHCSSSGTFHGLGEAVELRRRKPVEYEEAVVRGLVARSRSGGADIAAAVVKVDRPLAVVTSGYDGRSAWRLRVFEPGLGLVFDGSPAEYRGMFAAAEEL